MKYRAGFVSNSSSSSFIIQVRNPSELNGKMILPADVIAGLLKMGFRYTSVGTANALLHAYDDEETFSDKPSKMFDRLLEPGKKMKYSFPWLGLFVACNQADVIEKLEKSGIPFKAATNYGTETVIFDGKTMKRFVNYGVVADIYGAEEAEEQKNEN